ncbi:MAG: bifunctional folylpolyglutamate synthase/dihydrofolate synthase [Alphaproteobacteria bacterium]
MNKSKTSDLVLARLMSLHPKVIDLVLDRVYRLLKALGNPHHKLPPVVHIAGTNGKGSTLAFLRAAMEAAHKSVHVYTSPHLVKFHERIRLGAKPAGALISEADLMAYLERCEEANLGQNITYFEITTVAGLLAFAEHEADYLLLETGLGGRLDATNVVEKPVLTLITPISNDHAQFLGNSVEEIAFEKAGIMKAGVPCLSAEQVPEVKAVLTKRAEEIGVTISFVEPKKFEFDLSLLGEHQNQNAALAEAAAEHLGLSTVGIETGLKTAVWPGRFQKLEDTNWNGLSNNRDIWLDGGHNAAAGQAIAEFVRSNWSDQPLHVIYGMLNTKEASAFLDPLSGVATSLTAIEIPEQENSLTASQAAEATPMSRPAESLKQAFENLPDDQGRILICGSLYLAGWVLREG